jgi:type II secretory pathway pseudopilin PulG
MRRKNHGAFTLLELLVVIGIIVVLIALMLRAVQKTRNAAAQAGCAANLKQLGLAAHQYHNTNGSFPAGMRYRKRKDPQVLSSWLTQVLPYVEQGSLWRITQDAYAQSHYPFKNPPHLGLATVISTFACPADGRVSHVLIAQKEKIAVAFTSYLGVEGTDLRNLNGILYRE